MLADELSHAVSNSKIPLALYILTMEIVLLLSM